MKWRRKHYWKLTDAPQIIYVSKRQRNSPKFDNLAINQNTMISQVKTDSAQITYKFSVVTRQGIVASTRHLGRLDAMAT